MEDKNVVDQAQTVPIEPLVKPLVQKQNTVAILLGLAIIILLGLTGFLAYQNMQLQKQIAGMTNGQTSSSSSSSNNTEVSQFYSVNYPSSFFIDAKSYNEFRVADKKWLGNLAHIPDATIHTYYNVIPDNLSLRDWLNGVGDPNSEVGTGPGKSCKDFLNSLRQQLKSGDLLNDPYLKGDSCIYFGISNLKDISVNGVQALQFNDQGTSTSSTHTILVHKANGQSGNSLFDILYTNTGLSDQNDPTIDAYNMFISTFKFTDQTSQIDTSNWKTYTSQDNKLTFKVPVTLDVNETAAGKNTIYIGKNIATLADVNSGQSDLLVISYTTDATTPPSYSGTAAGNPTDDGSINFLGKTIPKVKLVFQGKTTDVYYGGGPGSTNLVKIDQAQFIISTSWGLASKDGMPKSTEDSFDQILSTFKFTN